MNENLNIFEVRLFNEVIAAADIKTLFQVAAITSKSPSQLYDWTVGKKIPKTSTTLKIAKKLGVVVEFPKVHKI